uniref:Eukaryotic translation initiation factor 4E transporter n=1 Tax=Caenorhabditis tropicalis TaxID=1561998 RepID=A0A1I7UYU0_9PELO
MDIFCETTKAHIENEATEVEKIRRDSNALIFSPGTTSEQIKAMVEKDDREQSLTFQLTMIYLNCSHFCRLYQQIPIKLQQLMNSTLEKQFDSQKLLAKRAMDEVMTDQRKSEVVYAFAGQKDVEKGKTQEIVHPVKASELRSPRNQNPQIPTCSGSITAENALFNINDTEYQRKVNHHGYRSNGRKANFESERPSSFRGNERNNAYRVTRWNPVHDTQTFNHKDREIIYKNVKHPPIADHDRNKPQNDTVRSSWDEEKLYYADRGTPFKPSVEGTSDDVRRSSESRDSNYESSWENPPRHWTSETENATEDSENRMLDQTIRSVHSFNNREQLHLSSKPGPSNSPSQKNQERKQPKKGFNDFKFNGNQRNQFQRKQRYSSSNYHEHEEETPSRLKQGQPDREEIANALGYSNRSSNSLANRREGFYNR